MCVTTASGSEQVDSSIESAPKRVSGGSADLPLETIIQGVTQLASRLMPPFGGIETHQILTFLQERLQAEAAAIFFVSEDDPNELRFVDGVGYEDHYREAHYFLKGRSLTSWVYSHREPVSKSRRELETMKKEGKIHFSGRCQFYLATGRFTNIISVPILLGGTCVGVLKVENKAGLGENDTFPDQDLGVARVLASVIAVAYQQERYLKLWEQCEKAQSRHRVVGPYLQEVASHLSKFLNAESASVFLKHVDEDGNDVLRYAAGTGYKDAYQKWVYKLDGTSLTAFVAEAEMPLCKTEEELEQHSEARDGGGIPYRGACRSFIQSGSFRGLIVVPLLHGPDCLGVLKVENKRPDNARFDEYDLRLCEALARVQIIPMLVKLRRQQRDGSPRDTAGYKHLKRVFGESRRLRKDALRSQAKKVAVEMRKENSAVKADDCAAYLQISRPHFYRLIRS